MGAQRGLDILIKIGDGGAPESFATVAGLRAATVSLNAQSIDATHAQSPGRWREILEGAGARSASVSGSGLLLDDAAGVLLREIFFSGAVRAYRLAIPGLGEIEGRFHLANLDYAGEHDGEATVALALASAGALTFTSV